MRGQENCLTCTELEGVRSGGSAISHLGPEGLGVVADLSCTWFLSPSL
jgi:hypothetical protein